MEDSAPFVHRFRTTRNRYVLDVNTNRVLRIDAATWDVLDDFGRLSQSEIVAKLAGKYPASHVAAACHEIRMAQRDNGILRSRSFELPSLPSLQDARALLDSARRKLTLCVTENCNLRCGYCVYGTGYTGWREHSVNAMDWTVARRAIDEFVEHSNQSSDGSRRIRAIGFYGGEPLLNMPLIKRCVAHARKRFKDHIDFHVTTNATLLAGAAARFLASERFLIHVSVDGPRAIHDSYRQFPGGSGTWDVVTRNIHEFVEHYLVQSGDSDAVSRLGINLLIPPLTNALEVEEFFSGSAAAALHCNTNVRTCWLQVPGSHLIASLASEDHKPPGIETIYKKYLANAASGNINEAPNSPQWTLQRGLYDTHVRYFLNRTVASPGAPALDGRCLLQNTMCLGGLYRCFVSVDGHYYPCERVPCRDEYRIGDVWSGLDVAKSYALKARYIELCKDECERCWCVNFCHAGCCSNARDSEGLAGEAKQRVCQRYRRDRDRMLRDVYEVLEANPQAFDFLKSPPNDERL